MKRGIGTSVGAPKITVVITVGAGTRRCRRGRDALDSRGYAHTQLADHDRAIACYGEALGLWRELSVRYYEADTLDRAGRLAGCPGDPR